MKKIMKTVQSSYLHLSNILLNQVEFSNRIIESSFLIWLECLNSTSQFNSTLFSKKFNSTRHFSSWILDSNSSTQLDVISLQKTSCLSLNSWSLSVNLTWWRDRIENSVWKKSVSVRVWIKHRCLNWRCSSEEDVCIESKWKKDELRCKLIICRQLFSS